VATSVSELLYPCYFTLLYFTLVSLMVVHYLYKCCGRRYLPVKVLLSLLLLDFQCKSRAKDALQAKYRAIIT